jgi:hypothetical protein
MVRKKYTEEQIIAVLKELRLEQSCPISAGSMG